MTDVKTRPGERSPVDVPFSPEAFDDVQRMAKESNKSVGEVIQESLAIKRWVTAVIDQGGKVVGEKRGQRAELELK